MAQLGVRAYTDRAATLADPLFHIPPLRVENRPADMQLEALANSTHAPFGFLFWSELLEVRVPIADFRTIAEPSVTRALICSTRFAGGSKAKRVIETSPVRKVEVYSSSWALHAAPTMSKL